MAIFTIGDLHLSLGTSKPMDIFSGWENYVERLRENWLAAVRILRSFRIFRAGNCS